MKHKHLLFICGGGALCVTILRALQLLNLIDGTTGFEKIGSPYFGANIIVYTVIGLISVVSSVLTAYLSKRQPVCPPDMSLSPSLAVVCFIMALYYLCSAGVYLLTSQMKLGTFGLLYMLFLLLNVVFYIFYGASAFGGVKLPKLLSIAPILLVGYNLVSAFISYTGVVNISDNIFQCLFLCSALFFFLLHGKILSEVDIRRSARLIFPTSLLVLLFGCASALSPIIVGIIGKGALLHTSPVGLIENVFVLTYACTFTFNLYKKI